MIRHVLGSLLLIAPACLDLEATSAQVSSEEVPEATFEVVDLRALDYRTEGVDLFRSSAFYNPRTRSGAEAYLEFPDHYAARLFGAFSWEIHEARDLASFRARLEKRAEGMARLAELHDKFIVPITFVPDWLSGSKDTRPLEGWYRVRNAQAPGDVEEWKAVIRELVSSFRDLDVEMYYEFWNEPDGFYWKDDLDAFLDLYEETARTVKALDPDAKVGGAAVNAWDGKLERSPRRGPVNLELIRFAKERSVPLDFVSWHQFSSDEKRVGEAVRAYREAIRRADLDPAPELVVSEWSISARPRNTQDHAALMARLLVTFLEEGVDLQTVAAWENFHPDPDPDGYGLVTQSGVRKSAFHVHRAFDELSRGSQGIALLRQAGPNRWEGDRQLVISRKSENEYQLLVFEIGWDRPLAAALQTLLDRGVPQEAFAAYTEIEELREAIRRGEPRDGRHREAFETAGRVLRDPDVQEIPLRLEVPNTAGVEVTAAQAIKQHVRQPSVIVEGNRITCDLEKFEVLLLDVRLR